MTSIVFFLRDFIPSIHASAVDIFVQYGTLFFKVALLSAIASLSLCSLFPPPVFITRAIFLEFKTSTMWGDPLLTLFIILHLIPCLLIYSAVQPVPQSLKFNFDKIIANDKGAAVIWHGESEALYDAYNNKYVYIYEVNDEGLVSSITEYTDLLLSASSLLGQKINTNFKEK